MKKQVNNDELEKRIKSAILGKRVISCRHIFIDVYFILAAL